MYNFKITHYNSLKLELNNLYVNNIIIIIYNILFKPSKYIN